MIEVAGMKSQATKPIILINQYLNIIKEISYLDFLFQLDIFEKQL